MPAPPSTIRAVPGVVLARAVELLVVLLFPASVVSAQIGGIVFWLIVLVGIATLAMPAARAAALEGLPLRTLAIAVVLPIALNLASVLLMGLPFRNFSWIPFLGLLAIALAAHRLADPVRALVMGNALACVASMGVALYSKFVIGAWRPVFAMNALMFGALALSALIVTLWSLSGPWRARMPVLLPLAAMSGCVTQLLAGYRGGLLALPIVVMAFLRVGDRGPRRRVPWRGALAFVAVLVVVGALAGPKILMIERIESIRAELKGFGVGYYRNTSISGRIYLWRGAVQLALEHPLTGVGARRFAAGIRDLQAQGRFPADIEVLRHAHNSFFTIVAEYGLPGFALMIVALVCIWRALAACTPEARLIGRYAFAAWLVFALTNDIFAHQNTMRVLFATLGVCMAARARRSTAGRGAPHDVGERSVAEARAPDPRTPAARAMP